MGVTILVFDLFWKNIEKSAKSDTFLNGDWGEFNKISFFRLKKNGEKVKIDCEHDLYIAYERIIPKLCKFHEF